MLSGGIWNLDRGHLIILATLMLLFVELVKSTYTNASSLVDHGLSMIVFIACLIEFLMTPQAATSVFFLIVVATAIDVMAAHDRHPRRAARPHVRNEQLASRRETVRLRMCAIVRSAPTFAQQSLRERSGYSRSCESLSIFCCMLAS